VEKSHYYPSATRFYTESTSNSNALAYRYNGKEMETMNGLHQMDYGARRRFSWNPSWTAVDPLAEKYYSISPYAFCGGNSMNRIEVGGSFFVFVSGFSYESWNGTYSHSSVYPDYVQKEYKVTQIDRSLHYNQDIGNYWGDVSQKYNKAYHDEENYYINASYTPRSSAQLRYKEGEAAGQDLVAKLTSGEIDMSEGETIKIVGHSQGAAFAAGMAYVIANSKYKSLMEFVDYLSPHQPKDFINPKGVDGRQFSTKSDKVASMGFLAWLTGSSYGKIKNSEWGVQRDGYESGYGGHQVNTWLNDLIAYWQSIGITVTVK